MQASATTNVGLVFLRTVVITCGILSLAEAATVTGSCLVATNELSFAESRVTDTLQVRSYTFCPNSILHIGTLNYDNRLVNGMDAIPLRPNLHIKCGNSGRRHENCVLMGGDLLVDGTNHFGLLVSNTNADPALENVIIEGFTFVGATRAMVWITKPGKITFIDCVFRDSRTTNAVILADFFPVSSSDLVLVDFSPATELVIVFRNCLFQGNRYAGQPAHASLVVGNGSRNRLVLEKTQFKDNDMVTNNTLSTTNSFLISTSGPLTLIQNCFENNLIGVSPVASFGGRDIWLADNNYQASSSGPKCSFVSNFVQRNNVDAMSPSCIDFVEDVKECQADWTLAPTMEPSTATPVSLPSTRWISQAPTMSPSSLALLPPETLVPTLQPLDAPSQHPSLSPTKITASPQLPPRVFPRDGEPLRFDDFQTQSAGSFFNNPIRILSLVSLFLWVYLLGK